MNKPSDVRIPNAETIEALQQARDRQGLAEYATLEDLKAAADYAPHAWLRAVETAVATLLGSLADGAGGSQTNDLTE